MPEMLRLNVRKLKPEEIRERLQVFQEKCNPQWNYQVTMGCDPEMFLQKEGQRIPAFFELQSKEESRNGLFWDGFQGEFTVEPSVCHQVLAKKIRLQLDRLPTLVDIVPSPIWRVPDVFLATATEDQVRLGCDPSSNVYGLHGRPIPDGRQLRYRSSGGHIHFELPHSEKDDQRVRSIIKAEDAILGVVSVCLAQKVDLAIRRQYYGLAGEYRLPPHGVEYRTLSNFWLFHPAVYHLVFDIARLAYWLGRAGLRYTFMAYDQEVVQAIQYSDVRLATEIVKRNKPFFDFWLGFMYSRPAISKFWDACSNGVASTVKGYGKDIRKTWTTVVDTMNQPMWNYVQ